MTARACLAVTEGGKSVRKARTLSRASPLPLAITALALALFLMTVPARSAEGYETAGGFAVYLGVMPAALVKGHPGSGSQGAMHGGTRGGEHEQHVVVAIFNAASGERVEDARVVVTVSGLGHVGHRRIALEPMAVAGTVTYGAFIDLPGRDRFQLEVDIDVPGRADTVRVVFPNEHIK